MTNEDLYKEIIELRSDVKRLNKEFYLFKGKAFGFMGLLSFVFSVVTSFIFKE